MRTCKILEGHYQITETRESPTTTARPCPYPRTAPHRLPQYSPHPYPALNAFLTSSTPHTWPRPHQIVRPPPLCETKACDRERSQSRQSRCASSVRDGGPGAPAAARGRNPQSLRPPDRRVLFQRCVHWVRQSRLRESEGGHGRSLYVDEMRRSRLEGRNISVNIL